MKKKAPKTSRILKKAVSVALLVTVLAANPVWALTIRQENQAEGGVLVSRPVQEDTQISHFIYRHNIQSVTDYSQWLQSNMTYVRDAYADTWAKPEETIRRKKGDCEDFSFLNMAVLRVLGYEAKFLALVREKGESHAICVFKYNGYYVWFDNNTLKETRAQTLQEFAKVVTDDHAYDGMSELDTETNSWTMIYKKS